MGSPKLTWILISIPLIGMITGVFGVYWASLGDYYGYPADTKNLTAYNKLAEINADMKTIRERTTSIKEEQGALDRIGNFFSNAFSILMSIPKSFNILFEFLNIAIIEIPLGESGDLITISLQTILLIIIFIGIILAILLKVNT